MIVEDSEDARHILAMEQACDWVDRLGELSAVERRELDAWIKASALNAAAFARVRRVMIDPELIDAAERVRRDLASGVRPSRDLSVSVIVDRFSSTVRRLAGPLFQPLPLMLAGGAAAALIGVVVMLRPAASVVAPRGADYATTVGVRSDTRLSDDSVLHLNADSRVHVQYSARERAIRLDRGEAMFDVTHDAARPFNVSAAGVVATAVGTTFEVDLLGDAVEIQVFNGVVKVADRRGNERRVEKGEWLILAASGGGSEGRFQTDLAQTWRADWLQADNLPLKYVVARLNRYADEKIVVQDPSAGEAYLTGRFDLRRTQAALAMVTAALNLTETRRNGHIYLSRSRNRP